MANMRIVNQYIKTNFPTLKIGAVRGSGYVYFDGEDGFDKVESLMVCSTSVTTNDLVDMVIEQIANVYPNA
jgi:hypothetical protein